MIRQKLTVGLIATASAFTLTLSPAWAGQRRASRRRRVDRVSRAARQRRRGLILRSIVQRLERRFDLVCGRVELDGQLTVEPAAGRAAFRTRRPAPRRWRRRRRRTRRAAWVRWHRREHEFERRSHGNQRGDGNNHVDSGSARPRDGRPAVGTAVDRRVATPGHGGGVYYPGVIYDPYYAYYYNPYYYGPAYSSYWSPYGYGFGLGYFAYDPFLFGGYGSYSGAYGNGGYGYDPYQGGGGGSYGGSSGSGYRGVGSLRLKVKPSDAQVYVDGYYMGVVDSFDGSFQKLTIEEGAHKVEVKADGYKPVQFDVMVVPGETVTYKGELPRAH